VSGIHSGGPGVVLGLIYGLALGWLRHTSGGLLFPIVAHIMTDAAILTLVLMMI
jgi:membrane protease YdiL (CAAX protease family)